WLVGFIAYRFLMTVDFALGNTVPDMVITMILCYAVNRFRKK
ncbi:MAG: putative hydroxymethylpyrimidine transporter CytX, partial [Clostridiales bacterium]|nr:putative hydroxymethylpyrimidine transporter CytX [Clostridiales bacterium]